MIASFANYFRGLWRVWNQFWFAPASPETFCLLRVLAGAMLFYTHLIWSWDLHAFFGPNGWIPTEVSQATHANRFLFSYFPYITADWLRWTVHIFNLLIFFCFMIGLFSRTMAVLAFLTAVSYAAHVTPGAFFGLDKINVMLAMYLMLGPCGARYSVDHLLKLRKGGDIETPPSVGANLGLRLMQLHMCVIYLFGGLGKLQGDMWWDGRATWFSVASVEYRSLDMTWLANWLYVVDFLTHATVFLEIFYCCLVWNRWARPWVLLAAIGMHVFIGGAMGMITFGLVMIFGNLAFLPASWSQRICEPFARPIRSLLAGQGGSKD